MIPLPHDHVSVLRKLLPTSPWHTLSIEAACNLAIGLLAALLWACQRNHAHLQKAHSNDAANSGGGPPAGHADHRNLSSVLRSVLGARNVMIDTWTALAALSAASLTHSSASWPLLKGLDITAAADVLCTLQVCRPLCHTRGTLSRMPSD